MHIIAKGKDGCPDLGDYSYNDLATCTLAPNLGTEVGSDAHFIADHYEELPGVLLFTPSSRARPARYDLLKKWTRELRQHEFRPGFECHTARHGKNVEAEAAFGIKKWNGHHLLPAEPHGLGPWLRQHTDTDAEALARTPICWNGVFKTTGQLLRQRPRQLYVNLTTELEKATFPECGHYVEHSVGVLFSGKEDWTIEQHTTSDQFTLADVINAEAQIHAQEKQEGESGNDDFPSYVMAVELAAHQPHDHARRRAATLSPASNISAIAVAPLRHGNESGVTEVPLRAHREAGSLQADKPTVRNETDVTHLHTTRTDAKSVHQRALRDGA